MPRHVRCNVSLLMLGLLWLVGAGYALAVESPQAPAAPAGAPEVGTSPNGEQPAKPPVKAGELVEAQGQVRAQRAHDPVRVLAQGSPVFVEDTLATGPEDKGKVVFGDGSSLDIGPGSQVLVADFAYDAAEASGSRQAIRMAKGLFRYVSGKVVAQDPARLQLESPLAVIGIRGTTVDHKIVWETKNIKGLPTEVVKEEIHALRATTHSQVVVDQHGLKSVLTKPGQAAFLRPDLRGSVRPLTKKEMEEFSTIPVSPSPFDPRPGRGGFVGGGS